jgi:GMP synthase (glutamine-hydrolysing)
VNHQIIILDFGSQVTQLIARNIREANVYCTIQPYHQAIEWHDNIKGVILSGSPASVYANDAPSVDVKAIASKVPVLGICYGAQLIASTFGAKVQNCDSREYGRANLEIIEEVSDIFSGIKTGTTVWMSHGDTITELPAVATLLAKTESIPVAAFTINECANPIFGLQFHPEVTHSTDGKKMIQNFVLKVCEVTPTWTPNSYVEETTTALAAQIGNNKVIMALSGGVDSTVAAMLIHKAIGDNLYCIFVDNGLLRKDEFEQVLVSYKTLGLQVKGINASEAFYNQLAGITNPE